MKYLYGKIIFWRLHAIVGGLGPKWKIGRKIFRAPPARKKGVPKFFACGRLFRCGGTQKPLETVKFSKKRQFLKKLASREHIWPQAKNLGTPFLRAGGAPKIFWGLFHFRPRTPQKILVTTYGCEFMIITFDQHWPMMFQRNFSFTDDFTWIHLTSMLPIRRHHKICLQYGNEPVFPVLHY